VRHCTAHLGLQALGYQTLGFRQRCSTCISGKLAHAGKRCAHAMCIPEHVPAKVQDSPGYPDLGALQPLGRCSVPSGQAMHAAPQNICRRQGMCATHRCTFLKAKAKGSALTCTPTIWLDSSRASGSTTLSSLHSAGQESACEGDIGPPAVARLRKKAWREGREWRHLGAPSTGSQWVGRRIIAACTTRNMMEGRVACSLTRPCCGMALQHVPALQGARLPSPRLYPPHSSIGATRAARTALT